MTNNNLLYYLNENNLPSGVTLRNATKDDTDNMFKWEMETVDKSIRNDPKTIRYIKKDVQESIKLTKMIMYNGETIGMFTTDRLEPGSDWWYIGEIYIVKEHRNKGIGTALLKEEISRHDKIKLKVAYSNPSAMKLYKSLGFEVTDKNDKGGMYIMSLDKTKSKSVNEACKDLKSAREFVSKVGELAKKYNANYFIVTDGASGIHNDGNPAVKNARDSQIKWEKEHGFDPDEDWSKDKSVNEQASILNEVKQFPIEFDKEGNLIIYKSRIGSLAFGDEIHDSVQLLQVYRNSSNIEGMKYELAKLWYINDCIEKKLKKRLSNDEYKELIDTRATCLNVFKTNLDYVMKTEKGFNFSDYYNSTPFSDNSVKITANTLKYAAKTIAGMI